MTSIDAISTVLNSQMTMVLIEIKLNVLIAQIKFLLSEFVLINNTL